MYVYIICDYVNIHIYKHIFNIYTQIVSHYSHNLLQVLDPHVAKMSIHSCPACTQPWQLLQLQQLDTETSFIYHFLMLFFFFSQVFIVFIVALIVVTFEISTKSSTTCCHCQATMRDWFARCLCLHVSTLRLVL